MSEEISVRLRKKRGVLRTALTKGIQKIETELEKAVIDIDILEESVELIIHKAECLKLTDNELEQFYKPEEFEKEFENSEKYQENVILWKLRAAKRIRSTNLRGNVVSALGQSSSLETSKTEYQREITNVKLPKLSIVKFYGELSEWLTFWNSFETAIHKNESLDKISKFNYLVAHLGGSARRTIEGFAISVDNYDAAINLLNQRFGRKDMLINTHMNVLLNVPPLRYSNDTQGFRRLFDRCQTQIRSLESLGVTSEMYGSLLCPLLFKLLPSDLVLEYNKTEQDETSYKIKELMEFLAKELSARERAGATGQQRQDVRRRSVSPPSPQVRSENNRRNPYKMEKEKIASAAELFSTAEVKPVNKNTCVFCNSSHISFSCNYARNLSFDEKKAILRKKGVCFRCLKGKHVARNCEAKITCSNCQKRHVDIMCWVSNHGSNPANREIGSKTDKEVDNSVLTNHSCSKEVYLQTLVVRIRGKEQEHLVRVIIDTGSQKSYISKFSAKVMGLKSLGEETVTHGLFGGLEISEKHKIYRVNLSSIDQQYCCQLEVMDQKKICAVLPKVRNSHWINELNSLGIYCSDSAQIASSCLCEENSNEIQLLIGADIAGKLFTGKVEQLHSGLVAVETKLGWTVMGKASFMGSRHSDSSLMVLSLHVNEAKISDLWDLDSLGILDPSEKRSKEEIQDLALKHFKATVSQEEDGRYKVCLPWLEGHPPLLDHRNLAERRLKNTVKSLKAIKKLEAYEEVFDDWENDGIIENMTSKREEVNTENCAVHYLPHRPVFKENSTTKIRPVFDGSAKFGDSVSLNDCVEKGPNLIELIPSVLNRFRVGKIGIIADIRKAFLQIGLNEQDRNLLKFLWWKEGDPHKLTTYRHCRVVFGISCSPFLLAATLVHHLDQVPEHLKGLAEKLKNSLYVDNCVTSVDTVQELAYFQSEAQKILSSAKFDLRGWQYNNLEIEKMEQQQFETPMSKNLEVNIPVLGLSWNTENDTLSCDIRDWNDKDEPITKRKILSLAHKIFDPIGFTCPVTLFPKLLLQQCWKLKVSWDTELPESIVQKFQIWRSQIIEIGNLKIPRRLSELPFNYENSTLHVFCDASQLAYATCIFLRVGNGEDVVTSYLVQARSRVSPLKNISIPRLELLACSIGARLAHSIKGDLRMERTKTYYWSDSMDAIYWIKNKEAWAPFVANRVNEIRRLSGDENWFHVPGALNPADLPSRGCTVKKLVEKKWWEGPDWLRRSKEYWPDFDISPNIEIVSAEKKKTIVSSVNEEKGHYYHRISSYMKVVKITGWIYRFSENSKKSKECRNSDDLSVEEIRRAEHTLLKRIQLDSWKFIPPDASWWGEVWERLSGVMKRVLRNVSGKTSLNLEEMSLAPVSSKTPDLERETSRPHFSCRTRNTYPPAMSFLTGYWVLSSEVFRSKLLNSKRGVCRTDSIHEQSSGFQHTRKHVLQLLSLLRTGRG